MEAIVSRHCAFVETVTWGGRGRDKSNRLHGKEREAPLGYAASMPLAQVKMPFAAMDKPDYTVFALTDVTVSVAFCDRRRSPQAPDGSELSVTLAIHPLGSLPEDAHAFAVSVVPTARR